MEFNINKNSTLPVLKMELIKDGRNDFQKFHDKVQNAMIYFTMTDVITGVKKIAKKLTTIEQVVPSSCVGDEFFLIYQFSKKETSVAGRYVGQFEIVFLDDSGTLIVPIHENLYINILDSDIRK